MFNLLRILCLLLGVSFTLSLQAQSSFWISGQVRPRFEFRQGFKTLRPTDAPPAAFIEQRTKLTLGYQHQGIQLFIQPQDVRTWGSTPLVNNSNGFFTLFQGWAQLQCGPRWSVKVGRQVWSYDNQRILGGLDWAAQGRAHDGLLVEYKADSNRLALQLGAAYNNAAATLTESPYNIGGNYKTLQFARLHRAFAKWSISLLALNIGRQDADLKFYFEGTMGGIVRYQADGWLAQAEGYYQLGYNGAGLPLQGYLAALKLGYQKGPISLALGGDLLSGTDAESVGAADGSFNPWLGTNHIFYGHLDYFYVGVPHGNVGLLDAYAQVFYTTPKKRFRLGVMYHYLNAPAAFAVAPTATPSSWTSLGHEVDLAGHYVFRKGVKMSFGYAQMWGNEALETLKPNGDAQQINHWGWVMLDVNLELFRKNWTPKTKADVSKQRF